MSDQNIAHAISEIAQSISDVCTALNDWKNSVDRKTEVIDSYQKCIKAVQLIRKHCTENPVLGFDCEWVDESEVSLLQLCTHKGYCALIRLCSLERIPNSLAELLSDQDVIKVGVGVKRDAELLGNNDLNTVSTLDLRFIAVLTGSAKPQKLSSMYEEVLGKSLNKAANLTQSDWDTDTLSKAQIEYAAGDAIAGIEVYMKLAKSFSDVKMFKQYFDTQYDPYHHNDLKPQNECSLQ